MTKRIIKSFLALVGIGILLNASLAQQIPAPPPASESQEDRIALHQALLDLTNPWTVMCIAAHPDDEDGTSLIVMRRKYGAHTVSLFSTFGEGGQNAIGPELYEELGAIRVRETMAAAEIQGSEPYFLGLKDFGYSKSADETFRFWGHDEALRRMVLQIRQLRPDVIITNHSVTNNDHGHHQATARLELEAFDAAADPKRFPEQLQGGVTIWQVQRLFVRAGRNSQTQANDAQIVTIDPNERDPIRDTIYAKEALRALQKHATQGPWPQTLAEMARVRNSQDGKLPTIRYVLVREAKGAPPLPSDSHNLLAGLRLTDEIARALITATTDPQSLAELLNHPQRALAAVVEAEKQATANNTEDTVFEPHVLQNRRRYTLALAASSGVSAKIISNQNPIEPGSSPTVRVVISNNGPAEIKADVIALRAGTDERLLKSALASKVAPGSTRTETITLQVPATAQPTLPHADHLYDSGIFGFPLAALVMVELPGKSFSLLANSSVDIGPAVEITDIRPSPLVATPGNMKSSKSVLVTVVNHRNERVAGRILVSPGKLGARNVVGPAFLLAPGGAKELRISMNDILRMKPQIFVSKYGQNSLTFSISIRNERKVREELVQRTVPLMLTASQVVPGLTIGYVRGFDYSLPNALRALGAESKELSVEEVKKADLQGYSAILVDNRVYESQPELVATNQRLLDYAKDGGTLIVFYHKSNEWNPNPRVNRPQLAPYPIVLGDGRVTDENAAVTFISPEHPLLNTPNKIGQEDFAGWIQERGLYYPKEWDAHYQALLAMNDPGEAPLKGGLLVADYGRGHYIYTSMVWYRQLRAGVPGAYRMLANMISYGKAAQTSVCDPPSQGLPLDREFSWAE